MGDLISRDAAIEIINRVQKAHIASKGKPILGAATMIIEIEDLPSAQPERKTGRWINHEDEDGEHYGDNCSECGEWYVMPFGKSNFCPNCGADMRKE